MTTQINRRFHVSLYASMCLAAIGLWLGEESPWPYPWLLILGVIAAYAFTDQWQLFVLPGRLAPFLGFAAIGCFGVEELNNGNYQLDPVLPLGHLILLFMGILLFQEKKLTTRWLLLIISFLLMMIAALHNNRLTFGTLLAAYLALATWSMMQFLLLRESNQYCETPAGQAFKPRLHFPLAQFQPDHDSLQPREKAVGGSRQVGWLRLIAGSFTGSAITLATALMIFLIVPRQGQVVWSQFQYQTPQHLSGFDERIRLGQLGTILESDEEVMTVRMTDENGQPYAPQEEPYWRGIALTHYEDGRWERRVDLEPYPSPWWPAPEHYIHQEIRLQAVHRDVLFGLRPAFRGQARSGEKVQMVRFDGTLMRPEGLPAGPLQYSIDSAVDSRAAQRGEFSVGYIVTNDHFRRELTQIPDDLRKQLRQYVAALNPPSTTDPLLLAGFLVAHLQDPDQFDYTLHNTVTNRNIDPVLDFLLNRKEGHCEYFASSLALMLRAYGVPARVVNGFKGGDINEMMGRSLVVRQKHAHSWVEAILQQTPDQPPDHWVSLDPTPGQSRQRVVAMVNPTPTIVRQMRDLSRQFWSSYVLNFNASEQEIAIYGPLRQWASDRAQGLVQTAKSLWATQPRGFNWIAAMLASAAMAALLFASRFAVRFIVFGNFVWAENGRGIREGLLRRIMRRVRSLLARWSLAGQSKQPRIAFYEELLRVLEAHGLHKQPAATPRQFAQHAAAEIERTASHAAVARIPAELVDRYYRVRFGHELLNKPDTNEIGRMLSELSVALGAEKGISPIFRQPGAPGRGAS